LQKNCDYVRVPTVREKSGKNNFSRSGKSQTFENGQGNLKNKPKSGDFDFTFF